MKLLSKLRFYSKTTGELTAFIGTVVLVGWVLDWESIKSVLPGLVTMKANTALGFLLGGLGLRLWYEAQKNPLRLGIDRSDKRINWLLNSSRIAVIAVFLIGFLTLVEYGWNIDFGIDQLLVEDINTNYLTSHPGRMAPTTALNFFLLGLALLLLHLNYYNIMQILAMMSSLVASLSLVGYLYQMPGLYAINSYTAMALHTSFTFILLSSGVLLSCPERGWLNVITSPYAGGLLSRRLLPGIIAVPLLLGGMFVTSYHLAYNLIEITFALTSVCNILILGSVTWWNARYLNALDLKNQNVQLALRQSQENLEQRIQERTAQLGESRKKLANLINTLPGIVFCRLSREPWSMSFLSDGCLPLTGYGFEELTTSGEQTYNNLIHHQDRLRVFEAIQRAIAHQNPYEIEYRICSKLGQEQWVWEKGNGIFNEAGELLTIEGFISNITKLKQTEMALEESRNRFRAILDAEPECVKLVAADGRLLEINAVGLEILEVEQADRILGCSIYSFIAPEYQDTYRWLNQQVCAGNPQTLEFQIISAKGTRRWMETHAVPLQTDTNELTFHLAITRDISDRKSAEAQRQLHLTELDQWRHRYEIAAQMSGQILYEWESDTGQLTWGPNTEQILGYSLSEMPKTVDEYLTLIHPDYRLQIEVEIQRFLQEKDFFRVEYLLQRQDQTYIWVEDRCQFFRDQTGEFAKIVGFVGDISDRKQAEFAIVQLNQELEQRVRERTAALQATNQELEAFCYSVSHDLRAPLRHISSFTRILQQKYTERFDEKGQHYIERIGAGTQRMEELIHDLLSLSRISRSELKRTWVNLSAIAEEIANTLNESQPDRQVEWAIAQDIIARGDQRLLRVVLENLLNNAWKFTANQTLTRIELNAILSDSEAQLIYFVKDNGAGFDMAYSDKLFKVFQRLHSQQEFPGTGVGLATVQRIIHRHGGRVWATSQPHQGATFYFTVDS